MPGGKQRNENGGHGSRRAVEPSQPVVNAPTFNIRHCELSDVGLLEHLISASAKSLQLGDYSSDQIEGALGTVFGVDTQLIRDRTYFVVETDSRIVGCGGWSKRKTLFGGDGGKSGVDALLDPSKDAARIRAFFVHPDYARRDIGSALVLKSERAAIESGFQRIEIVATLTGEKLYQNFGYRTAERYEVRLRNGLKLPVVRMTKDCLAT